MWSYAIREEVVVYITVEVLLITKKCSNSRWREWEEVTLTKWITGATILGVNATMFLEAPKTPETEDLVQKKN